MKYNKANRMLHRINKHNRNNRPVLHVRKTAKHIYAHITHNNKIICQVSSIQQNIKGYNKEGASLLGSQIGKEAQEKGVKQVTFNRTSHVYAGRIESFAKSAREFLEF